MQKWRIIYQEVPPRTRMKRALKRQMGLQLIVKQKSPALNSVRWE